MNIVEFLAVWDNDSELEVHAVSSQDANLILACSIQLDQQQAKQEVKIIAHNVAEVVLKNPFKAIQRSQMQATTQHPLLEEYLRLSTVFCNAVLPFPQRFQYEFDLYIQQYFTGTRNAWDYLNTSLGQAGWLKLVESSIYNILTAPHTVALYAVELLTDQGLEPRVLPQPELEMQERLFVQIVDSWFVCESAVLELG